jgi:hypothetical protein
MDGDEDETAGAVWDMMLSWPNMVPSSYWPTKSEEKCDLGSMRRVSRFTLVLVSPAHPYLNRPIAIGMIPYPLFPIPPPDRSQLIPTHHGFS